MLIGQERGKTSTVHTVIGWTNPVKGSGESRVDPLSSASGMVEADAVFGLRLPCFGFLTRISLEPRVVGSCF